MTSSRSEDGRETKPERPWQEGRSDSAPRAIGRFVVLRRIGRGGMGSVFSAYDEELGRRVAIKLLRSQPRTKQARRIRMRREAQAMARVSHPNVVQVYEVGEFQSQTFIAMEFVDGQTLESWQGQAGLEREEILEAYRQAGAGLAAAHRAGVLHRDFKPTNALIDDEGRVRVTDFGLAAWLRRSETTSIGASPEPDDSSTGSEPEQPRLTREGSLVGTPAFMSPEQYRSQPLDARSDQFAFCVSLYEALSGQHPFGGKTIEDMREAILGGRVRDAEAMRALPTSVRLAIVRGLATEPLERWSTMDALLQALSPPPPRHHSPRAWIAAGVVGLGLAGSGAYAWIAHGTDLCRGSEQAAAQVWSDERRASAAAGLSETGHPLAAPTWERVEGRLGAYIDRWRATRTAVCEATQVRGEQSATLMDLRMACLDLRLDAATSLLDRFADADIETVLRAVEATSRLPEIQECERANPAGDPSAPSPAAQELRRRIIDARAQLDVGRFDTAIDELRAVQAEAELRQLASLTAEAIVSRGQAEREAGRIKEADETLEAGLWAALAASNDRAAFDAAIEHTAMVGVTLVDRERGLAGVERSEALLTRLGESDRLRIDYLVSSGAVLGRHGVGAEARARLEEALELSAHVYGTDHPVYAAALNTSGMVALWSDDFEDAARIFEAVIEIDREIFDPAHVRVASPLNNLAIVMANMGDLQAAKDYFGQAYEIRRAALGDRHVLVGDSLMNNAGIARALEDYDSALSDLAKARAIYAQSLGENTPKTNDADLAHGMLLISLQRDNEAEILLRDVLARQRELLGEDHRDLVQTIAPLATLLARTEREAEAIELLGQAIEIERETLRATAADPRKAPVLLGLERKLAETAQRFRAP